MERLTNLTTFEDVLSFKKEEIKAFLKSNHLKVTGSKAELVKRVSDYLKSTATSTSFPDPSLLTSAPTPSSSVCCSDVFDVGLYDKTTDDFPVPDITNLKSGWTSDKQVFPAITHNDVENYLINSRHNTIDKDKMSCYRQFIQGFTFYKEGYIHNIMCNPIDVECSTCYVRSKCFPSMKKGVYSQFILIAKRDPFLVVQANCTCPAGLGEGCTHIAGLLFALEGFSDEDISLSCTSKPCQWNKPVKRIIESKSVENLDFKRIKYGQEPVNLKSHSKKDNPPKTLDLSFRDKLCLKLGNSNAVLFDLQETSVTQSSESISSALNVSSFEKVVTSEYITYASDKYIHLLDTVQNENMSSQCFINMLTNVSDDIVVELANRTIGQSHNDLWKVSRKGRITASIFHDIKTRKVSTPPEKLVDKIIGKVSGDDQSSTDAMKWGMLHEPIAKKRYKAYKKLYLKQVVSITETGLFLYNDLGYIGASPDGIIKSNDQEFLIEIKCPYKWRNKTISEACQSEDFYCFVDKETNAIKLKTNHRYYTQIQGQLAVCKFQKCEFVIYTNRDMKIIEINFDDMFWQVLVSKIKLFYETFVIPAILQ